MLQLEIPLDAIRKAMEIARASGVPCMLDPAPVVRESFNDLLAVDLICPNETEAAEMTNQTVNSIAEAESAAKELHRRGAKHVVITLGEKGCLLLSDDQTHHIESIQVTPVDSTAAGDAFAGALAVRWCETNDLVEAARFAVVAGALATTQNGAQSSLFGREAIDKKRR
jgi:ribokinase